LNAVEGFFSGITRRRIRRGVFKSVADLEDAIKHYIADHNRHAKPFAPRGIVMGAALAGVLEIFTPGLLLARLNSVGWWTSLS
jgi:hypothetical protein